MLLLDEYEIFLRTGKNLSNNTALSYIRDINKFHTYLNTIQLNCYSVSKSDISEYLSKMQKDGQAVSSLHRMIASLRSYYGFIFSRGAVTSDPTVELKAPRLPKREYEFLTAKETEKFLKQPSANNFKGARDKAMLELMYSTGIKLNELINLKVSNVNLKENFVLCTSGKQNKILIYGSIAKNALKRYINEYRFCEAFEENNDYLFVNTKGGMLSRQGFWKIIKYYKDKANIDKEINSNILRRSFAIHLIENGADISAVQNILGHMSLNQ